MALAVAEAAAVAAGSAAVAAVAAACAVVASAAAEAATAADCSARTARRRATRSGVRWWRGVWAEAVTNVVEVEVVGGEVALADEASAVGLTRAAMVAVASAATGAARASWW
jgi:hypothetical protein